MLRLALLLLFCCAFPLALPQAVLAQEESEASAPPISAAEITEELESLQADDSLDAAVREAATALLNQASEDVRRTAELRQQQAEHERLATEAPQRLAEIREELLSPPKPVTIEPPPDATLAQLENLEAQAEADLEAARRRIQELQGEAAQRSERSKEVAELIAQLDEQLIELRDALRSQPAAGEAAVVTAARRLQLRARIQALEQEIETLRSELRSYDARRELLPARSDRAGRRVSQAEARYAAWQDLVSARRKAEAAAAARRARELAREEAVRRHKALQDLAAENEELAATLAGEAGLAARIATRTDQIERYRQELQTLREKFSAIWRRIEASGLNRTTGFLLRRQFEELPESRELERELRRVRRNLEDVELMLVEYEDRRNDAGDIDRVVRETEAALEGELTPAELEQARVVVAELARARRDLLDQLVNDSRVLFDRLATLDLAVSRLLAVTESYVAFVEERILWVRSIPGDQVPTIAGLAEATSWFTDAKTWRSAAQATGRTALERLPVVVLLALTVLLAFALARSGRRRLATYAELVSSYRTDKLAYTLYALYFTLLAAVPVPLLLFAIGWTLLLPTEQPRVVLGTGNGLLAAAILTYPLFVLRETLRSDGLAPEHFRWPPAPVESLRRHLRWLLPVVIPVIVLVVAADHYDSHAGEEAEALQVNATLGRLAFSVGLLAVALFVQRLLRPSGPTLSEFFRRNRGGWVERLRYLWYPLLVGLPLAMVVLAWTGYYYTALQFQWSFDLTLIGLLVLVLANALFTRWLFVARRRVAIEDARRRREQAVEAGGKPDADAQGEGGAIQIDEQKLDLPAISAQTRQLFRAALAVAAVLSLYFIWADVLPALRLLDRVQIWPEIRVVERLDREVDPILRAAAQSDTMRAAEPESMSQAPAPNEAAADPASSADGLIDPLTGTIAQPESIGADSGERPPRATTNFVSLADIGLALIVIAATAIAFRNLPGFIEIVILQRLPLDPGSRYALSTVLRYTIAIVGIIVAFQLVGFTWNKVQWLAAALTFGLAFGLQEIFANFVSGLIILGERPVRVGDTVTVGTVTGTVTRIRMRATTITDWDRKELIIPNKNFITGDVINWTLSDPILRVIVPVGVSYGSDIDKVTNLLSRIAQESEIVLAEPKPRALFLGFGDSTLNFEVRVFIPHIDYLLAVRHELHMTIMKRFREANIEIAFPQRDLHVRSIGDLAMFAQKREDLPPEEQR